MNLEQFKIENNHLPAVDYVLKLSNTDDCIDELLKKPIAEQLFIVSSAINKDFISEKLWKRFYN
jgi:hypothetical protein